MVELAQALFCIIYKLAILKLADLVDDLFACWEMYGKIFDIHMYLDTCI